MLILISYDDGKTDRKMSELLKRSYKKLTWKLVISLYVKGCVFVNKQKVI